MISHKRDFCTTHDSLAYQYAYGRDTFQKLSAEGLLAETFRRASAINIFKGKWKL